MPILITTITGLLSGDVDKQLKRKDKSMKQDYYSDYAKRRYEELQNKPPEKLTEKEKEFIVAMYHIEEFQAGLL